MGIYFGEISHIRTMILLVDSHDPVDGMGATALEDPEDLTDDQPKLNDIDDEGIPLSDELANLSMGTYQIVIVI